LKSFRPPDCLTDKRGQRGYYPRLDTIEPA
jgi:hypothetical protein